jgi:hypothetical protein
MVLFLLSLIIATILVASPRIRNCIGIEGFTRSENLSGDLSIAGECAEQSTTPSPMQQFLIVVLPDGTIVTPRVAARL